MVLGLTVSEQPDQAIVILAVSGLARLGAPVASGALAMIER
jgi:hypothetical protein